MHQCCAFGCNNKGVHSFPKDPTRRKQWKIAVRRKHFEPTKHSRLCMAHFKPEDYQTEGFYSGLSNTRKILKKGVVPSIFIWKKEENIKSEKRRKRLEIRNIKRSSLPEKKDEVDDPTTEKKPIDMSEASGSFVHEIEIEASEYITHNPDNFSKQSTRDMGTQKNHQFFTVERFRNDDKGMLFYTGLESFDKFMFVFHTLCPEAYSLKYRWSQILHVSTEDQFFLTLIKLRRNKEDYELGLFFDISPSSVSNIFITWINFIHQMWKMLDMWPSRELVDFYMPDGFEKHYPTTRVIVDCTEVPIQRPTNPVAQQAVWSSYKNRSTVKFEVGASPGGLLTHCSQAYGGSTSDRQIVERSSLLDKCEKGDSVMADRGFNVQDLFASKDVTVNIPSFLKGKNQLPGSTVLQDRKLASKRIHIERLIGQTKTYRFLQTPINIKYVPLMSKIYFVCQMLSNFKENIVSEHA